MRSVGIDIGSFSVKLAEIEASSKSYRVIRMQEFPLSTDPTRDTQIEIIDILRNLASEYPAGTQFTMAVAQKHISLRHRTFPFRERHKILKSIAFELEDDIPFSQDEAVFEGKIVRYIGPRAEILALACPKERIEEALRLAGDSGIEVENLTMQGAALINMFEDWEAPPPEIPDDVTAVTPEVGRADVVLEIGHQGTQILIMLGGVTKVLRHVDWGGKNVAEAISHSYKLHYIEALVELQKKGFILINTEGATKDQIAFSAVIKESVDQLVHEVRLTLLEAKAEHQIDYNQIYLLGGACQIRNLGAYLTQKLEIAANRLKTIRNQPHLDFAENPQNELTQAMALGLAIEGIRRPRNPPINFLKDDFARQSQTLQIFWDKWRHAIQVAAAAFVVFFLYSVVRDTLAESAASAASDALKTQAANIAGLKGPKASTKNIRAYIKKQEELQKNHKLAEKIQDINSGLDVLNRLSQLLPSGRETQIDIKRFMVENDILEIEGEANTRSTVDRVRHGLSGLSRDGKIDTLPSQIKPAAGKLGFAFRTRVSRVKGG